ncbi:MAG: S41 family peptidase [Abitibacteriaceae bacterium]|nr:S41 family peptidase [Abditibacteriaceae bacterium]
MTWKTRGAYGSLILLALLTAFGVGYRTRAHSEEAARDRWLPTTKEASQVRPLVRTADGQMASGLVTPSRRSNKADLKPYETLDEVRRDIKENFVKTQVDDTTLTYGAIRGMLRSLGDRFTRFLTPEEYDDFQVKNKGEFTGIGAHIDVKEDYMGGPLAKPSGASRPYIVEPIEGGPAAKASLKKDDIILEIDGRNTADMNEDATVNYIRGERGTPVHLKIERKVAVPQGAAREAGFKDFDVTLTRDTIEIHPVKLDWLPERIAWLRLDEFNQKSDHEMTTALQEIQKGPDGQGPARGIVFDMRNNPGGLLDVAVQIGSRFIPSGPIVITRERNGSEQPLNAQHERFLNLKMPIVVLVNKYSASAAEIVTGALKDKGAATVVGEQSYGKASVQVLIELKNGGALVITTAKYLTPAKHDITDKGITPDIAIKPSPEDEQVPPARGGAQLQKAIEIIKGKTSQPTSTITARAD